MTFHWHWHSQLGSARFENQDYAAIAMHTDFLFAVVADGVFCRPRSGELARQLTHCLIDRAITIDRHPTALEVRHWLSEAFQHLSDPRAPQSSTSFIAACFSPERLLFAVHAGDCRLGVQSESGGDWKTSVHSLANATRTLTDAELRVHPARNQLTRTFNTKRYSEPELTELGCGYVLGAVLATDGFWAELPIDAQRLAYTPAWQADVTCEDDISRLLIHWEPGQPSRTEASINLHIRTA
jgi:serine/threonine protein phosphatase PrpC